MKKIRYFIIIAFSLSSCDRPQTVVDYNYNSRYSFVNKSGVNVTIKREGDYFYFPTSLVLENNEVHSWEVDVFYPPITEKKTDPVTVSFNETVSILYDGRFEEHIHDPRNAGNYVYELLDDGRGLSTYTFTVEDYQRALELNNTDK